MSGIYQWFAEVLRQEFDFVRSLKEGPRGNIYLIRHRGSGQRFVLRHFTGDARVYEQLTRLACDYLPNVYQVASRDRQHLVLEEYVQGDTLGFLLRDSLFTPKETRRIVTQVCRGLWVLHNMDAVHRDIKPENIILCGDRAVLIDFDAARVYDPQADGDTRILGTTGFAAPEQYGLSQSDVRSDIYALGILINVMLTGEHPSKKLAEGRMGRIVQKCTQVNPEKRYRNVLQLMEVL